MSTLSSRISTFLPAQGEKTYISAPNSAAGWSVGSGTVTVTTTTVSSNLPRATVGSAMLISGGSTGDYVRFRFTADVADVSTKLKWAFAQRPISWTTSNDWKIEAWYTTDSTYASGLTQLTLSTDSSSVTNLPNANGQFRTTFDTNTALYYELRFKRAGGSGNLGVSDNICGAGIVTQGAAVTGPVQYTPTTNGFGGITSDLVWYSRVGSKIKVIGRFTTVAVAASEARVYLPTGLNIGTYSNTLIAGSWWLNDATNGGAKRGDLTAYNGNPNYLIFTNDDTANTLSPFTSRFGSQIAGNSQVISFTFEVEVAEWAGGGTVNLAQNDTQYCYNTGSTTTAGGSDTTSFGSGPAGTPILSINSASTSGNQETKFRCRASAPLLAAPIIEVDCGTSGAQWVQVGQNGSALPSQGQSGYQYGISVTVVNATDFDVGFGNSGRLLGATYASGGAAWSGISSWRWRARVSAPGQAVGFAEVNPGISSGLVSASGLKGNATGNAIATGYVGEVIKVTGNGALSGTSGSAWVNRISQAMTAGKWLVFAGAGNTTGGITQLALVVSDVGTVATAAPTDAVEGYNYTGQNADGILDRKVSGVVFDKSTAWTLYAVTKATYTSGSINCNILAVRIA